MKRIGMISFIIMICFTLVGGGFGSLTVSAADWKKPVYAYGDGISESEMENLAKGLGYELNDLELLILHVEDMEKYIGDLGIGEMYSSAIMVKQKKGFGIEVRINNPELITEVTEGEYENAMITAGVVDMLVLVDSPVEATGHSALTGIYKAYDTQGEILDEERMKLAQDELVITSGIVQEHQFNESFDADRFNNSMRGVKLDLGKEKKDKVDEAVVDKIITGNLKEEDLDEILTEYNIQDILDLFMRYSQTSAIDDAQVKEQLEISLGGDIDEGFFKKVMSFFSELFASIFGSKLADEEVSSNVEPEPEEEAEEPEEVAEVEEVKVEPEETIVEEETEVEGLGNIQGDLNSCSDDYEEVLKDLPPNFFIPDCAKITKLNKDLDELIINLEVEGDWLQVFQEYKRSFEGKIEEEIQDRTTEYGELTVLFYKEETAYTHVVITQIDSVVSIDVVQMFP